MHETLLSELRQFVVELEKKEAAAVYMVPGEIMNAVKKAKSLEKLLHEIFMQVSGSGGIRLSSIIRREFGIKAELMDRFEQWASYSKELFEDELHDAIDRVEIRAGNQGVFFAGTPSKKEAAETLQLLKDIAHAALRCQFQTKLAEPGLYVDILDKLLQFYALPNTYPEGNAVNYRNLISADRLYAMSGGDDRITDALKAFAKEWYQQSPHSFLESKEGYFSYEFVRDFLHALTKEQLERLRSDYIRSIEEEFKLVRVKPDLYRAKKMEIMLETVLSWTLYG
ncbi:hypothetical protein L1N85_26075 [Paenibacillus alkaliterrae]|uniref:hypothetical protein n=1 Tax=Paenibacillus alkaliterrae TaxID=320909 RepID=UPI001F4716E5|nr:hypothetical protein [Paenibacillus alkaliterrae]MCF2941799.1 hypothetical protein [Paenibacillus alkaliterrae]